MSNAEKIQKIENVLRGIVNLVPDGSGLHEIDRIQAFALGMVAQSGMNMGAAQVMALCVVRLKDGKPILPNVEA